MFKSLSSGVVIINEWKRKISVYNKKSIHGPIEIRMGTKINRLISVKSSILIVDDYTIIYF